MFVIRWTYLIKKIIVYFVRRSTQKHYIILASYSILAAILNSCFHDNEVRFKRFRLLNTIFSVLKQNVLCKELNLKEKQLF